MEDLLRDWLYHADHGSLSLNHLLLRFLIHDQHLLLPCRSNTRLNFHSWGKFKRACESPSLCSRISARQEFLQKRNLTFLYPILADQDLLVLNKADLLCARREGLQVPGEGARLSEGLAAQATAVRPLICA